MINRGRLRLSSFLGKEEKWLHPAAQILALEEVVSVVAGVEEAREGEVQMLEELGHQAVGTDKG